MTEGLVKIPKVPLKLRNQIRDLQKKLGQDEFYKRLIKIDPLIKVIPIMKLIGNSIVSLTIKSTLVLLLLFWIPIISITNKEPLNSKAKINFFIE